MNYTAICSLPHRDLVDRDVAELNLLAAKGLPGTADVDVHSCLEQVEAWADLVRLGIKRVWKRRARGEYAHFSSDQFRVLVMITILQRDLGVRYNPACMAGDYDATDACDHFIHGLLAGHGGTCSSLPILYLAIGRRLGFPLHLVRAKEHLFVRWESHDARFNIEPTARGFVSHDDDHYASHPKPLSLRDQRSGEYLRNLTASEELACHFFQRGRCWADNLDFNSAIEAISHAQRLHGIYRGDFAMFSMAKRLLYRMGDLRQSMPWDELLPIVVQLPRTPDEAWAARAACDDLLRIMRVHLRKVQSPDEFFAKLTDKELVNV